MVRQMQEAPSLLPPVHSDFQLVRVCVRADTVSDTRLEAISAFGGIGKGLYDLWGPRGRLGRGIKTEELTHMVQPGSFLVGWRKDIQAEGAR